MSDHRVLHIDDDPAVTRLVATLLKREGYQVTSLNDSSQAIPTIVSENFRVVVTDMEMPVVDGLDLLRDIKHHDGGIQVVLLTGIVSTSVALEAMRLGAYDCVFKPIEGDDQLIRAVAGSFETIERWTTRLRDLTHRRKADRLLSEA